MFNNRDINSDSSGSLNMNTTASINKLASNMLSGGKPKTKNISISNTQHQYTQQYKQPQQNKQVKYNTGNVLTNDDDIYNVLSQMKRKPKLEESLTAEQQFKMALEARKKKDAYQQEYNIKNKDRITQTSKKYREQNADLLRQRQKEYRDKNKDMISKKKAELIHCECGKDIKVSSLHSHKTSIRHLHFLAEKAKKEKYYKR